MAYTLPTIRTWTDGENVNASLMNAQLRDGLLLAIDPPRTHAWSTSGVTATPNNAYTSTAIDLGSEDYDTDTMHSTSSNTQRVTINTAGLYRIVANGNWAVNATGTRMLQVRKNSADSNVGGTQLFVRRMAAATAGGSSALNVSFEVRLAANDYLELFTFQDSGGTLDVNANTGMLVRWIAL